MYTRFSKAALLSILLIGATGCSTVTMPEALRIKTKAKKVAPIQKTKKGWTHDSVEAARIRVTEKLVALDFEPAVGSSVQTETISETNLDGKTIIDLKISWTTETALFPIGEHDIRRVARHNGTAMIDYLTYLKRFVEEMSAELREMGPAALNSVEVIAEYTGSADGIPIKSSGITYEGEYGIVHEYASFNGAPSTFRIDKGDMVSNAELALLRAVSLQRTIRGLLDVKIEPTDRYSVWTYHERGQNYRSASVTFRLSVPSNTVTG